MINVEALLNKCILKKSGKEFYTDEVCWKTDFSNKNATMFFKHTSNSFKYVNGLEEFKIGVFDDEELYDQSECKSKLLISKKEWLEAQKIILDELYPLKKSPIIAITGTNGKTSVSYYLEKLFINDRKKVLRVGTLGEHIDGKKISESNLTTPSFIDIRKLLANNLYDVAVFEASSHSLEQERFYKLEFAAAGWTNFTQDHLDYHGSMEAYFKSKMKIKKHLKAEHVLTSEEVLYKKNPEVFKKTKKMNFSIEDKQENLALNLEFNRKNIELSYGLFEQVMSKESDCPLVKLIPARGRFNFIKFHEGLVVIDYAHTPDALEKICSSLKEISKDRELIVLFGCGGDRDRLKRKFMSEAVEKYADKVFLTSDNPRSEDPMQIINDALVGFEKLEKVNIEPDREESIKKALKEIGSDILLIAGKGHENYQEIKGVRSYFSDFDIVESTLSS